MNLALGALIILLLLLPALFFRLGISILKAGPSNPDRANFARVQAKKNFLNILSKLNFSETLFFFSIVPLLLHCASLGVLDLLGYEVDYQLLTNVFSSQKGIVGDNVLFNTELITFLQYTIIETVMGFIAGWLVSLIVINTPSLVNLFIGENMYFRLFTGMLLEKSKRDKVDLILVDIVSETKETTVIYSGFLEKFDVLPDKQELAFITLTSARRRDLRKKSETIEVGTSKQTVYDANSGDMLLIPGKYFTIPGTKISNVNVSYFHLQNITIAGVTTQDMVAVN